MAWTTYRVPAQNEQWQGSGYEEGFDTYRYMKGNVQARLISVTLPGDAYWEHAQLFVRLLDAGGTQYGAHWINKTYGVMPGFARIGVVTGGRNIRLRTQANFVAPSWWVMELRYDGLNVS
ncbi:MAG: hypothetical protein PIR02_12480 [Microbacterium enclense]